MAAEHDWLSDGESATDGSGTLAAEFAVLTGSLLNAPSAGEALTRIVETAQRVIPGADLVSITLRSPDGAFHTPIETEPIASDLDQVQYTSAEGPCVAAASKTGPAYVRSDDLATEPAWPTFGPIAAGHGFTTVLSTTLLPDARPPRLSGALNIYSRTHGALDGSAHDTALLLATHASLALATTQAVTTAELREAQFKKAIDSRDVIGQAKGILMSRRGVSADEAFALLRRASQRLNVRLADVAKTVAERPAALDPP